MNTNIVRESETPRAAPSTKRRLKSRADTLPMEQNTSFSAEVWIINQRTKRAFKRVYLSIVAHPKWKCLWWYIYENTIFMMIVGMNVCSPNSAQSFYVLPQRNTRNKTFFNHDAQAGIASFSLLFWGRDNKTRQLILLLEGKSCIFTAFTFNMINREPLTVISEWPTWAFILGWRRARLQTYTHFLISNTQWKS